MRATIAVVRVGLGVALAAVVVSTVVLPACGATGSTGVEQTPTTTDRSVRVSASPAVAVTTPPRGGPVGPPPDELAGTEWTVVGAPPPTDEAALRFTTDGVQVATGCRAAQAPYRYGDGKVTMGAVEPLWARCESDGATGDWMAAALSGSYTVTTTATADLVLTSADGRRLQLVRPRVTVPADLPELGSGPASPYAGRRFVVDRVIARASDVPDLSGGTLAVSFDGDGVTISGACNSLTKVVWTGPDGATWATGAASTSRGCGPQLVARDELVLSMFGLVFGVRVDGDTLVLTAGSVRGEGRER